MDQRLYQPKMSLIDFDSMILATAVLHPTFHMNQAQVPAKMSMKTESATGSKGGDHSGFTRAAVKKRFNWIIAFCPSSQAYQTNKEKTVGRNTGIFDWCILNCFHLVLLGFCEWQGKHWWHICISKPMTDYWSCGYHPSRKNTSLQPATNLKQNGPLGYQSEQWPCEATSS